MRPEHWLYTIPLRLRSLFCWAQADQELDDELRDHLERKTEEYLAKGMAPEEARRRARLELGGIEQTKEKCRSARGVNLVENFVQDLRYAFRTLRKAPRFALTAVLTLAVGIGATTVVFSVIYDGLLRPFPYKDASRLSTFSIHDLRDANSQEAGRGDRGGFTSAELLAFQEQSRAFEDIMGFMSKEMPLSNGRATMQVRAAFVTPNTFQFLGVNPLLGRTIVPEDAKSDQSPVFAMNYRLWQQHFNADPKIVGTSFGIDGVSRILVAIMPPRFQLSPEGSSDIWIPTTPSPGDSGISMNAAEPMRLWWPLGRIRPGLNPRAESADLNLIAHRLAKSFPNLSPGTRQWRPAYPLQFTMVTRPYTDVVVGNFKDTLYTLGAAVAMLLLITCTNVVNLLLARGTTREKEVAIRASIGASRGRLVRQLLLESLVLAAAGALASCLFAYWGLKGLLLVLPSGVLPAEAAMSLNSAVLLFALGVAVFTALLCGFVAAIRGLRGDLRSRLAGSGKGASGDVRGGKLRAGLVITEVALSILLLVGAGLMTRTLFALTHVNIGFNPSHILVTHVSFPGDVSRTANEKRRFFEEVLQRVTTSPGVIAASTTASLPPYGGPGSDVELAGGSNSDQSRVLLDLCSGGLFHTLGIHLLRGRLLSEAEIASAQRLAVVDETFARSFFGNRDPVGQKIRFKVFDMIPDAPHNTYFEILGVVSSVKNRGLRDSSAPQAYLPYTTFGTSYENILVRTSGDPLLVAKTVHEAIQSADRSVSLTDTSSLETYLQRFDYASPEFGVATFGAFAGIGLLLATVGIFGLMAYTVSIQTHEIGVRLALGAQQSNIVRMFLAKGIQLNTAGILIGLFASYYLMRFIAGQIWGVSSTDLLTFVAVLIIVAFVGLLACLVPAYRAARVDPMVALRYE